MQNPFAVGPPLLLHGGGGSADGCPAMASTSVPSLAAKSTSAGDESSSFACPTPPSASPCTAARSPPPPAFLLRACLPPPRRAAATALASLLLPVHDRSSPSPQCGCARMPSRREGMQNCIPSLLHWHFPSSFASAVGERSGDAQCQLVMQKWNCLLCWTQSNCFLSGHKI
jgi:hypothetical protein